MKPEITFKLGEFVKNNEPMHYLEGRWNDGIQDRSHRYEAKMFGQEASIKLIGSLCPLFRCALDAFIQQAWEPVKWKEFCDQYERVPSGDGFALVLKKAKE